MENIRNFSIIAHIDHGKSTLADRLLEYTQTIEKRKMKEQVLDQMDIERERGITIKMQPVSASYQQYTLNIIDTPGHIDFSYEVSRSLRAVEGVLLLIDATQGIQAQTLSVLEMAQDLNLTIIPVVTKIDMQHAQIDEISTETATLLNCDKKEILLVSGKTGEGVKNLLENIVKKIPPPRQIDEKSPKALVFDFSYSTHTGINAFARVFSGSFAKGERLTFCRIDRSFTVKDVGTFKPEMTAAEKIHEGMIGYFTTGIKEPGVAIVGDTITEEKKKVQAFPGYKKAMPVIWVSLYPQNTNMHNALHNALQEMRLEDAAFTFEKERLAVLGVGFRCGFLGMLHFETIVERVRRKIGIELIITTPSTDFSITKKNGEMSVVAAPSKFPENHEIETVTEPWAEVDIITPSEHVAAISQLFAEYEGVVKSINNLKNNRYILKGEMALREMMRQFFDRLKSISSGYASLSYKRVGNRPADVTRLDILLAEEVFPAFTSVVSQAKGEREAREIVNTLHTTIPREMFSVKIQARMNGRIVASKTLPALRKDVTAKLYGGDITRKMKLREKQKKGKKKMKESGKITLSHDTFLKIVQKGKNQ